MHTCYDHLIYSDSLDYVYTITLVTNASNLTLITQPAPKPNRKAEVAWPVGSCSLLILTALPNLVDVPYNHQVISTPPFHSGLAIARP